MLLCDAAASCSFLMKFLRYSRLCFSSQTIRFKSYLLSMGIANPVTRETHGSGTHYHLQLAKQLGNMLQTPLEVGVLGTVIHSFPTCSLVHFNDCISFPASSCSCRSVAAWWLWLRFTVSSTALEGWRWCSHSRSTLCWSVRHWGFFGGFFCHLSTAFISRGFGKRVQDVWVLEAPVEVSLCCLAYLHTLWCIQTRPCLLKEYIGQDWRLLHTGQALPVPLPVVGSGVQPSDCHFLPFPGVSKGTLACFPTTLVLIERSWLLFSKQFILVKYHFMINLLARSLSDIDTLFPSSVFS